MATSSAVKGQTDDVQNFSFVIIVFIVRVSLFLTKERMYSGSVQNTKFRATG